MPWVTPIGPASWTRPLQCPLEPTEDHNRRTGPLRGRAVPESMRSPQDGAVLVPGASLASWPRKLSRAGVRALSRRPAAGLSAAGLTSKRAELEVAPNTAQVGPVARDPPPLPFVEHAKEVFVNWTEPRISGGLVRDHRLMAPGAI